MNRAYAMGAVALTAAVLIFAMQNLSLTTVEFIVWDIATPVSLVALAPFLAGIVIGWLSGRFRKRHKAATKADTSAPAAKGLAAGDPAAPSDTGAEAPLSAEPPTAPSD
jgi:uncharacterized integral membrane protein